MSLICGVGTGVGFSSVNGIGGGGGGGGDIPAIPTDQLVAHYLADQGITLTGSGITGQPNGDFSDSKLLGAEIFLSPFQGDNLVYRTAMYSYFDLAKAYELETIAFAPVNLEKTALFPTFGLPIKRIFIYLLFPLLLSSS